MRQPMAALLHLVHAGANAGFVEPLIESGQRISASVSNDLVN